MYRLWRIAVRDLRRNKRRSALTMIAVMLGLALVIVLHGYEMGAMEGAIENNIRVQTGHLQVRAESYEEEKVSLKWEDLLQEPQAVAAQAQGAAQRARRSAGVVGQRHPEHGRRVGWAAGLWRRPAGRDDGALPGGFGCRRVAGPRRPERHPHQPAAGRDHGTGRGRWHQPAGQYLRRPA